MDDNLSPHSEWKDSSAHHVTVKKKYILIFIFSMHKMSSVKAEHVVTHEIMSHIK